MFSFLKDFLKFRRFSFFKKERHHFSPSQKWADLKWFSLSEETLCNLMSFFGLLLMSSVRSIHPRLGTPNSIYFIIYFFTNARGYYDGFKSAQTLSANEWVNKMMMTVETRDPAVNMISWGKIQKKRTRWLPVVFGTYIIVQLTNVTHVWSGMKRL